MDRAPSRCPWPVVFGARRMFLLLVLAAGAVAWWRLGLKFSDLQPSEGGWIIARKFLLAAFRPALEYETAPSGEVAPFLVRVFRGCLDTVRYAGAAVTLSLAGGFVLGFFGSAAWWSGERQGGVFRRMAAPAVYGLVRVLITFCRSIHELVWALLLLAAFGLTPVAAVIAIAIPYSGTLARVFSEMADEMPRDTLLALRASGATPLKAYLLGLIPRALPDLFSYVLYRFECGMRSAAVLSFMGFSTIGLYLQQAFDSGDYREAWTCLYAMLFLVLFFDAWSAAIRHRLTAGRPANPGAVRHRVAAATGNPDPSSAASLRRHRPRDRFLRFSMVAVGFLALMSLVTGLFLEIRWSADIHGVSGLFATDDVRWVSGGREWERMSGNLTRFLQDLTPPPLLAEATVTWREWLGEMKAAALPAAWTTLWISVLSIVLAGMAAWLTLPLASRMAAVPRPWLDSGTAPSLLARLLWSGTRLAVRFLHAVSRAVPEVILAFILMAVIGGPGGRNVWPAVLALALHNFGILGRLGAETVDNASQEIPAVLRAAGATRLQIAGLAVFPAALPRFLIYFFYRWETCLRETTALGILGVATLGFHIKVAESQLRYDRMLVFILLGAVIVMAGDVLSAAVRWRLRRAA